MYNKILLIVNTKAGKGKVIKYITKIEQNLKNLQFDVDLRYTTINKNSGDIITEYKENYDIILICGGDGTLNQALQKIYKMDKNIPITFIPTGTTNDFAKSLNVPFNKYELSKNLRDYKIRKIDIGKFNDKVFSYVASIGMFSKTSYSTNFRWKNLFGRVAYVFLGIKEIFSYKTYKLKVQSKEKSFEDDIIYGSISNSNYVGGFHLFKNENVKLDDGKFEVLFVKKPKTIFSIIKLTIKIINGHFNDENVYYFKTNNLKIESEDFTEWSIDGEYSGKIEKIEIENIPKKIEYLLP